MPKIELDPTRLLGFDQLPADGESADDASRLLSKVGTEIPAPEAVATDEA